MTLSRMQNCLFLLCLLPSLVAGNLLRGNDNQKQRALQDGPDLMYTIKVQVGLNEDGESGSASMEDLDVLEENILAWQTASAETADAGDDTYNITNVTIAILGAGYYPLRTETHEATYAIGIYFADSIAPNDTAAFMEELASEATEDDLVNLLSDNGGDSKFAEAETVVIESVTVTLDPNYVETDELKNFNETYILPVGITWELVVKDEETWANNQDYEDAVNATKEWIALEFDKVYPPATSDFALQQVESSLSEVSFTPTSGRYDHTIKLDTELWIDGYDGEGIALLPTVVEFMSTAQLEFSVSAFISNLKGKVRVGSPFANITQTAFRMDSSFEVSTLDAALGRDEGATPDIDPLNLGVIHFEFGGEP